jgi:hypothetical protein
MERGRAKSIENKIERKHKRVGMNENTRERK